MAAWQRPARIALAFIGIATAVVVYLNLGDRRQASRPDGGLQLPPRAVAQSEGSVLRFFRRGTQEYEVRSSRSITYDDGSTTFFDVMIAASDREGRDFVITAGEAKRIGDTGAIELQRSIHVREKDDLELATEHAIFDQQGVRADGRVSFRAGRLTGNGTGMTYDDASEVLRILRGARLTLAATGSAEQVDVDAAGATLDRLRDRLMLEGPARIVRGSEVTTTLAAAGRLTPEEDRLTFLELRGDAEISGGNGALQSMRANAIDLTYTADGQTVEHASLRGAAHLVLDAGEDEAGRDLRGETVDVTLRPGNVLDRVSATGGVAMTLPRDGSEPPSTVEARTLDASGGTDGELRDVQFTDDVVFREGMRDGGREARARTLRVALEKGELTRARFGGSATFTDGQLQARAADADYHPGRGRLLLRGRDAAGVPGVTDEGIAVEGDEIDIELESRGIAARGRVKTALRATSGRTGGASKAGETRLPGLLQQDEPVRITADTLAYTGEAGAAVYTGKARLLQGEATEMRAARIEIQRERGDLIATGDARSTLVFDTGRSTGEAETIRYVDSTRMVTYDADAKDASARAHVTGPQGDLRGRRIEVQLARDESRVETLMATGSMVAQVDTRTVHGVTLTYHARDERYVVTGSDARPVRVEHKDGACRETTGRTLTFTRTADTMDINGGGASRTQTVRRDACR